MQYVKIKSLKIGHQFLIIIINTKLMKCADFLISQGTDITII